MQSDLRTHIFALDIMSGMDRLPRRVKITRARNVCAFYYFDGSLESSSHVWYDTYVSRSCVVDAKPAVYVSVPFVNRESKI